MTTRMSERERTLGALVVGAVVLGLCFLIAPTVGFGLLIGASWALVVFCRRRTARTRRETAPERFVPPRVVVPPRIFIPW